MTGFLRWPATATPRDDAETADGTDWQIASETRIGAPMPRKRRKWLRRVVVIALLGGTGYALYDEPARGARWWSAVADMASPLVDRALQKTATLPEPAFKFPTTQPPIGETPANPAADPVRVPAEGPTRSAALDLGPSAAVRVSPEEVDRQSVPSKMPAATAAPARPAVEMQAYAPPEKVTVFDPVEARAKAAGLHPDLSRALLALLTDADYKNAAIATRTAVEKTPSDGTFKWPKKREAGQALFEVHFVPGAPRDCRRYVVTIEKQKWLTTAPPVDSCEATRKSIAH